MPLTTVVTIDVSDGDEAAGRRRCATLATLPPGKRVRLEVGAVRVLNEVVWAVRPYLDRLNVQVDGFGANPDRWEAALLADPFDLGVGD